MQNHDARVLIVRLEASRISAQASGMISSKISCSNFLSSSSLPSPQSLSQWERDWGEGNAP